MRIRVSLLQLMLDNIVHFRARTSSKCESGLIAAIEVLPSWITPQLHRPSLGILATISRAFEEVWLAIRSYSSSRVRITDCQDLLDFLGSFISYYCLF
jgi:hypothetical protein